MLANCVSFFLSGFMNLLASAIYAKEVMIEWQGKISLRLRSAAKIYGQHQSKRSSVVFPDHILSEPLKTVHFIVELNSSISENREKGNSDNYQWVRCIYIACVSGWILVIASVILFYSSRYQKLEEGKSDLDSFHFRWLNKTERFQ